MQSSISRLLLFLILLFTNITSGQGKTINLIYTGGVAGELEPCGCSPKTYFGGIPKRAGHITENKKELFPSIISDEGIYNH